MAIGCSTEKIMVLSLNNIAKYSDAKNRTLIESPLGLGS